MTLFQFEMRKLWKQKKLLWLFVIVLLCIGGILFQNNSHQSAKPERALEKFKPLKEEGDGAYKYLKQLEREDLFEDLHPERLEHINGIGLAFFKWTSAIRNEEWDQIPTIEKNFLISLEAYEKVGGEFLSLQGIEKEKVIQKNNWLTENNLSYEDEDYSLSPALILKEGTGVLFGFLGIFILLLFFGTTITAEMEQRTWLTLKNPADFQMEINRREIYQLTRCSLPFFGNGDWRWVGPIIDFWWLYTELSISTNCDIGRFYFRYFNVQLLGPKHRLVFMRDCFFF